MDYPCAKFGDFVSAVLVYRADRYTDTQTESQMRVIAILTRLSSGSVTTVFEYNVNLT